MNNSYTCSNCDTSFTVKCNFTRHLNRGNCRKRKIDFNRKKGDFICAHCDATFTTKRACALHLTKRRCRFYKKKRSPTSSKSSASASLVKVHPDVSILKFESNADFLLWKDSEEQRTLSKYSQYYGAWNTKTFKKIQYRCHRNGKVRERLKKTDRVRNLKRQGSCKINNYCSASILYQENRFDGKITVQYYPIHQNHTCDMKHLPLSVNDKNNIAEKLKFGVPLDSVLDDIRDTLGEENITRTQLITKHELHNIMKEKQISYQECKSAIDPASVEIMMEEYREKFGEDTPFKYYKQQGEEKDQFEKDDFFLVIMNSVQIALMKRFCCDKICVYSTHGTNGYDYHLVTVMVVNDLDIGVPVAHAIFNKENTSFLEKFFEIIKQECGIIRTRTFISDEFPAYIDAWMTVMEKPKNILLCTWHVHRNWRKNLNLVNGKQLRGEIYKMLRTLMDEENEASFPQIVKSAIDNWKAYSDTKEFGEYFEREYSDLYELWAFAFRKFIGTNTNMKLESMHKQLKVAYFRGLRNKRLDTLITTLLRMNRNKAFDRVSHLIMQTDPHTLEKLRDRHESGQQISTEDVLIVDEYTGNVKSQSNWSIVYTIKKIADDCCCSLRCDDCQGVCVHLYECNCDDYIFGYNMCKHIHAYALKIQCLIDLSSDVIINENETDGIAETREIFQILQTDPLSDVTNVLKTREAMKETARRILLYIEKCEGMEVDQDDGKTLQLLKQAEKIMKLKSEHLVEKHASHRSDTTALNQKFLPTNSLQKTDLEYVIIN